MVPFLEKGRVLSFRVVSGPVASSRVVSSQVQSGQVGSGQVGSSQVVSRCFLIDPHFMNVELVRLQTSAFSCIQNDEHVTNASRFDADKFTGPQSFNVDQLLRSAIETAKQLFTTQPHDRRNELRQGLISAAVKLSGCKALQPLQDFDHFNPHDYLHAF